MFHFQTQSNESNKKNHSKYISFLNSMVHNVRTTYKLSSSDNRRLYKFQFTPTILNFHIWFIYFLSAYVIFTITHTKFNEPSQWCGKSWHCKLPKKTCISPDLALLPLFSIKCHPTLIMFCDCLAVELNQTLSNTIEPNQRLIAPFFLWELDWIRLPNPIIWLSSTGFDWIWFIECSIWFDWSRRASIKISNYEIKCVNMII